MRSENAEPVRVGGSIREGRLLRASWLGIRTGFLSRLSIGGRHKRQLFGAAHACQQSPFGECATIFICAKNAGSEDFRYLLPIAGLADCRYLPPRAGSADCRLLPLTILSVPACYIERSTRDRNKAVWTIHRADNPTLSAWNSARTLLLHEVPCHSLIRSSSSFPFAGSSLGCRAFAPTRQGNDQLSQNRCVAEPFVEGLHLDDTQS